MKTLKILCTLSLFAPLVLLLGARGTSAGTVRITCKFENPRLEALPGGFTSIVFPATMQAGKPGEPSYPFRGVQALLPPGEAVARATVSKSGWRALGGSLKLYPAQAAIPGVELERAKPRFLYNASAYAADTWVYPADGTFSTHFLRGHAIASGAVSPVGYLPATGEAGYYDTVEIVLETSPSREAGEALALLRTDRETTDRVARLVENPSACAQYAGVAAPLEASDDAFEYLIITSQSYADDFLPLKNFYARRGIRASIMTIEEITTSYYGVDLAEQVRAAIKDKYIHNNVGYVLLAGDWDDGPSDPKVVPYRGLFCEVHSSTLYTDANIPADLYFAGLDGTWNADNDSLWGEPGEEDPYAEVAVGRAAVDSHAEVATFISKTIAYQESPVAADARRVLLLGEKLWDNPLTYGDDELEQLVGTCSNYGYTTTGFPPDFGIVRKYDKIASWNAASLMDEINAGTNWVVHSGHSNQGYVMRTGRVQVDDVYFANDGANAGFVIMNSTGCYAASFDNFTTGGMYEWADCIAEQMMTIHHCAVAFIGNSRFGWFTEGTTNGPSNHFQREFYDAVFTEGYTTLGRANERSKDETVPYLSLPNEWEPGALRWCFYTLNLLGDPLLDGWTDTPESLSVVHPSQIDRDYIDFGVETGVSGATASLYRDGISYGRGVSDSLGHIDILRTRAIPDSVTWLELNVASHNHYIARDTIPLGAPAAAKGPPPPPSLAQNYPNPFNPATTIRFSLPRDCRADLRVYNAAGREVACLVDGPLSKGSHAVTWAPSNVASGVYFYILRGPGVMIARKAVLVK